MVNDPVADWQHRACFLARSEHAEGYKSCQNTHGYLLHVPLPCFTPLLACLHGSARTPPEQQWSIGFSLIPGEQFSPGPDPVASKLYCCESSEGCPLCRKEAGSFPHGVLFGFFPFETILAFRGAVAEAVLRGQCPGSVVPIHASIASDISHLHTEPLFLDEAFPLASLSS